MDTISGACLLLFGINWVGGLILQRSVKSKLRELGLISEGKRGFGNSFKKSNEFVAVVFTGKYKDMNDSKLNRSCSILKASLVLQAILLSVLMAGVLLHLRPK